MSDNPNPSSSLGLFPRLSDSYVSAIGIVAASAIFAVVMIAAYLPNRPPPVNHTITAERSKRLTTLHAKETDAYNSYGWADKAAGVVRIPIPKAMELFVAEGELPKLPEAEKQPPPPALEQPSQTVPKS